LKVDSKADVKNCSVTIYDYDREKKKLVLYNLLRGGTWLENQRPMIAIETEDVFSPLTPRVHHGNKGIEIEHCG
jgi:hypothetical protein